MINKKSALVIQGPIEKNLSSLLNIYSKLKPIISTTDINEHNCEFVHSTPDVSDCGIGNINRQANTTLYGLSIAKSLGYECSLKIRSDFFIPRIDEFINTFEEIYSGKIIFYTWHVDGYMVDYLMYGKIEDLIDFWTIDYPIGDFAERILLNNYNRKHNVNIVTFNDSKKYFDYSINELSKKGIDFFWEKYKLTSSHYEYHKSTYLG